MIDPRMRALILERLAAIEAQAKVRILYACESGSRGWGFASRDSDYDVRFIFLRQPDWYLSVDFERRRDVLDLPFTDDLDIHGWDLRKALRLLHRSNPPLLEWLDSPIVYREVDGTARTMRKVASRCFSPVLCAHSYLRMAELNFRQHLLGTRISRKKYLYSLRPLLAVNWIERGLGIAPTVFAELVDKLVSDPKLLEAIRELLAERRRGSERDCGPRIEAVSTFIESELSRLEGAFAANPAPHPMDPFNEVFRAALGVSIPAPFGDPDG